MKVQKKHSIAHRIKHKLITRGEWQLYLLILPVVVYFIIFHYLPMYGVQIAFRNYSITKPILEAKWVGLTYFKRFLNSPMFPQLMKNTVVLSFYDLVVGFPFPVIFAVILNQTQSKRLVKVYANSYICPYFISMVVLVGMLYLFLSPTSGIVNKLLSYLVLVNLFYGRNQNGSGMYMFYPMYGKGRAIKL